MKNLTKKDLEILNIFHVRKNIFLVSAIDEEICLYEPYTTDSIMHFIYQKGIEKGEEIGKQKKIDQIKSVLNIDINT